MTYQDIIDNANIINDEYRMPFNDDNRASVLLYMSITEFVSQAYHQGEKDERRKQDLISLTRPFTGLAPNTKIVSLTGINDFMYVFELIGTFTDPCDSTKTIVRPIKPLKIDKHQRAMIDSFEKPDDYYPRYLDYNNAAIDLIEVLSDTAPVSYSGFYIKQPVQPTAGTLSNTPEFGTKRTVCMEIAQILSRKIMLETDDFNRYQLEQNETALNRLEPLNA